MQERRQLPREVSTSGRTLVLLILALSLALGMAIVAWTARSGPRRPPSTLPSPSREAAPDERGAPVALSTGAESDAKSPARDAAADVVAQPDSVRFDGRGIVRGEVVAQGGAAMPERWTLLLEPHPWLEGSEKAETRRIEFEHGETTFRVDDLPMGGYLVRAVTGDLNDVPASVLLVRGSPDQFVTLALRPSGLIDGSVIDAEGRPAEGLDVTLESTSTRERSTVSTDPAGFYVFRNVQDGDYELRFGRTDSPLLPVEKLVFRAPSLRFPTRTLPGTGTLKLTVVDVKLRPQPQARISGSAPRGSALDVFADHLGRATSRHLLPGHYVLDATSADGLVGHLSLDLTAGQEIELQILVRERQTPK